MVKNIFIFQVYKVMYLGTSLRLNAKLIEFNRIYNKFINPVSSHLINSKFCHQLDSKSKSNSKFNKH